MKRLFLLVIGFMLLIPAAAQAQGTGPTPQPGTVLTAPTASFSGTLTPMTASQYIWKDCNSSGGSCTELSATNSTYTVQNSDVGFTMKVENYAYSTATPVTSSNVGTVLRSPSASFSGTLTPIQGISYAWQDCNSGLTHCSFISGASNGAYTTQASDEGFSVRVEEYANSAYTPTVIPTPPSGLVSMAYWLGWEPTSIGGSVAAGEADLPYKDLTRVEMFSAEVTATSALNLSQNSLTFYNMPSWVAAMHSHGVQAFISIGDNTSNQSGSFGTACNSANQAGFISNLVNYATTNGFDGIDWDDEDGGQSTAAVASCYEALASAAHAAGLLITSEENQSIPTTDPYYANASDWQSGDGVVDEFYGYNPSTSWNCSSNCAIVTRLDGSLVSEGIPLSHQILGMATCCSTAQASYSNLSTTSATVDTSGTVTSIPLASALSSALPAGDVVLSQGGETNYEVFSTSGAASGATSIPVTGQVRGNGAFAFPAGAEVQSDYAGPWDCYNMGAYAKANGYEGNMDFDLQDNLAFECLDQIKLGQS